MCGDRTRQLKTNQIGVHCTNIFYTSCTNDCILTEVMVKFFHGNDQQANMQRRRMVVPINKELTRANEIIENYGCDQSNLIAIMQEIQAEYKYLSEDTLTLIAEKLGVSTAKVYSVATFYENFSLEAKGKYIIKVCAGTACHVRKSQPIYDAIHDYLGLTGKKKTSADGLFTLETVACLGACGLAPVMTIDGEVHSKMTPEAALALLEDIRKKEDAAV